MSRMQRKRFYVRVDLQLHAVTCPGVWLCTHGFLETSIRTLGYYFRTAPMEPRFPLLCHDQFTMEGYFKSASSMEELEHVLAAENLEITLWQNGRRLAYFQGKLADVMHPTLPRLTCEHNINVQLLMKATPAFPGIIAPKVELSAQVAVQDRLKKQQRRASMESYCSSFCNLDKLRPTKIVLDAKTPPANRHSLLTGTQNMKCYFQLEERRKQQPVCHARQSAKRCECHCRCTTPSSNTDVSVGSPKFEAEYTAHKNGMRKLSTCSSMFSSNSNTLSQTSCTTCSSCTGSCCRSTSATDSSAGTPDHHAQTCAICQAFSRVFH